MYGGKLVYGIGVFFCAIFTILSPMAAYTNFWFFIVVRAMAGLAEGVTYPAMHAMLAKWIPPMERSKFAAYVYAGKFFTILKLIFVPVVRLYFRYEGRRFEPGNASMDVSILKMVSKT